MVVDRKYRKALALLRFTSEPLPNAANSTDVLFDSIRCYASYASYCVTINTGVFPGKMCSDRRKNHGCGQEKPEGTISARFGVRTAANAVYWSAVPTELAAEPTPRRQIRNLNSSPSTKKTTELYFELFLSINVVSAKTRVTMLFRAKNAGYSTVRDTAQWCSAGAPCAPPPL